MTVMRLQIDVGEGDLEGEPEDAAGAPPVPPVVLAMPEDAEGRDSAPSTKRKPRHAAQKAPYLFLSLNNTK